MLVLSTVLVKAISAVYKIPLTSFIGAVGRGYFSYAYNLCMPIHAITMGAFPIALSKLVSAYNSKNDKSSILALKAGANRLFLVVGLAGMLIVVAVSKLYCDYIANCPKAIYTVLVLAPSILFSSMSASYRGYYEGFLNMTPTAVSQTLEAIIKMVLGLALAKLSMIYLFEQYQITGMVLGTRANDDNMALSLMYPYTSCASMLGVTLGSVVSWIYLWVYDTLKKSKIIKTTKSDAIKELVLFAMPIMISTGVQSVFQFLDTASVQYALKIIDKSAIKQMFNSSILMAGIHEEDYVTYIYGILSTSLDFKNIIPGITMALGVSAVPAVSRVWEIGDGKSINNTVNSIFRYTIMLSSLGGLVLYFCSNEILTLFYGVSAPDVIDVSNKLVKYFALTIVFYSLAGTAVFVVQAIGYTKKSIPAYIASGVIRVLLNYILVSNKSLILYGNVISGAVGYGVMVLWNIMILIKYGNIKYDKINNFLKPVLCFGMAYYIITFCVNRVENINNLIIKIMIIVLMVCTCYCILCILCGMLNFRHFFRDFNNKKMNSKS